MPMQPLQQPAPFPSVFAVIVAARLLLWLSDFSGLNGCGSLSLRPACSIRCLLPPRLAATQLARFSVANSSIRPTGLSPALLPAPLACTTRNQLQRAARKVSMEVRLRGCPLSGAGLAIAIGFRSTRQPSSRSSRSDARGSQGSNCGGSRIIGAASRGRSQWCALAFLMCCIVASGFRGMASGCNTNHAATRGRALGGGVWRQPSGRRHTDRSGIDCVRRSRHVGSCAARGRVLCGRLSRRDPRAPAPGGGTARCLEPRRRHLRLGQLRPSAGTQR